MADPHPFFDALEARLLAPNLSDEDRQAIVQQAIKAIVADPDLPDDLSVPFLNDAIGQLRNTASDDTALAYREMVRRIDKHRRPFAKRLMKLSLNWWLALRGGPKREPHPLVHEPIEFFTDVFSDHSEQCPDLVADRMLLASIPYWARLADHDRVKILLDLSPIQTVDVPPPDFSKFASPKPKMTLTQKLNLILALCQIASEKSDTEALRSYISSGQNLVESQSEQLEISAITDFYHQAQNLYEKAGLLTEKEALMPHYFDHISRLPDGLNWALQLRYTFASSLLHQGDLKAAEAEFKTAADLILQHEDLEKTPAASEILIRYGNMCFEQKRYDEAEIYLKKSLSLLDKNA